MILPFFALQWATSITKLIESAQSEKIVTCERVFVTQDFAQLRSFPCISMQYTVLVNALQRSGTMRAPGDRRTKIRFEVFGAFWGTFDAGGAVQLHDLTPHGALIEANQPLAVESVQSVCFMVEGQQAITDARVRHVRLSTLDHGRFLVGIEFLSTSTAFLEAVERLISLSSASA